MHKATLQTASMQTTFLLASSASDSSECVKKLIVLRGVVLLPAVWTAYVEVWQEDSHQGVPAG